MNQQPARALLLEQLESRCLLAGGVFAFTDTSTSADYDLPGDRTDVVASVMQRQHFGHDSGSRGDRSDSRGADRQNDNDRGAFHRDARSSKFASPNVVISVQTVSGGSVPRSDPQPTNESSVRGNTTVLVFNFGDGQAALGSRNNTSAVAGASVGDTLAERANVLRIDQLMAAGVDVKTERSGDPSDAYDEKIRMEGIFGPVDAMSSASHTDEIDEGIGRRFDRIRGGLAFEAEAVVDSFPLLHYSLSSDPTEAENSAWQLGGESLESLREVAGYRSQNADAVYDGIIADWFAGPGGFIDVESKGTALHLNEVIQSDVQIALDATLGRHRALDLFATGRISRESDFDSEAILLAIREQSSGARTLPEPRGQRLSTLVYSGAAVVASGLVLVAKRRQVIVSYAAIQRQLSKRKLHLRAHG